jgi:subtilisin
MKIPFTTLLALAVVAIAVPANAQVVPGRYIVVLHDDAPHPGAVASGHGLATSATYTHVFKGFAGKMSPQAAAALTKNPFVKSVEPDRVVQAIAQSVPTGIDRIDAESVAGNYSVDVDIAIIDSGIDLDHPDLNVVSGVDCRRLNKKTGGCKVGGDDDNGHGTHCAGTTAALDNGIGVVGVAPGARLHAIKVLDRQGSGYLSWIIQGLDHAAANADVIDVVNMSLGGSGFDDTDGQDCSLSNDAEHLAICALVNAGVTVVVAAGNESDDSAFHTPAAFDEVITVSALADFDGLPGGLGVDSFAFSSCTEDVDDSLACFSNYGHDVDIMAPGVGIYSTVPGGYGESSGTSMAAPHVAGAAALVKAANPSFTPAQVKAELLANALATTCNTNDGVCADDPDGIQEPFLYVGAGAPGCADASECDDSNECTLDSCIASACVFTAASDDTACSTGLCCGGSCVAPACTTDSDCTDGDQCTSENCLFGGTCASSCDYTDAGCSGQNADGCCSAGCDWGTDVDCPAAQCGDLVCAGAALAEDCHTCPADCTGKGKNGSKACCGDGTCTSKFENVGSCPIDCL